MARRLPLSNLPSNPGLQRRTPRPSPAAATKRRSWTSKSTPACWLPGQNVLAVEVHQQSVSSSDISFDLILEGGTFNPGNSTVYYTLDGTDPRAIGGQVSPTAILYDGHPFTLPGTRILSARNLDAGQWSPLRQVTFLVDQPASAANLRISEINYNPHDPLTQFGELDVDNDDFEFIELTNIRQCHDRSVRCPLCRNGRSTASTDGIAVRFCHADTRRRRATGRGP